MDRAVLATSEGVVYLKLLYGYLEYHTILLYAMRVPTVPIYCTVLYYLPALALVLLSGA
jgi:hypothetical protein